MARESASKGVVTWLCGHGEFNAVGSTGLDELGVGDDVGGLRDVTFVHGFGVGEHGVGEGSNFLQGSWLQEDEVMRLRKNATAVVQGDFDLRASDCGELSFVISERAGRIGAGLDLDDGGVLRVGEGDAECERECGDACDHGMGLLVWFFGFLDRRVIEGRSGYFATDFA